jgi:hypothetical protein
MAEGETANEYRDSGKDGIEQIEGSYGADTHEVEERPLDAQISEGLMQALEDSICAMLLLRFVWHNFFT